MGGLGFLPLWLGGGVEQPWVVNLLPDNDSVGVKVDDPLRFSVKDTGTLVDEGSLRAVVGYAKIKNNGQSLPTIPRSFKTSVFPTLVGIDANIGLGGGGIEIVKTTSSPQASVYAFPADLSTSTWRCALFSATVQPLLETNGAQGAVLGIEYGPRNTGVYLFLQTVAATPVLRLTGPDVNGLRVPNLVIPFDWTASTRYLLFWNELVSPPQFELYATDALGVTSLITTQAVSTFQEMNPELPGTRRKGGDEDAVAFVGQEGVSGDGLKINALAFATDVGFPILSGVRSGPFRTQILSDYFVSVDPTKDPTAAPIAPWFPTPSSLLPGADPNGQISVLPGRIRITKPALGTSFSVYREDPSLFRGGDKGFFIEATFVGVPGHDDLTWLGSGLLIYNGELIFELGLFQNFPNSVGLHQKGFPLNHQSDYFQPAVGFDWSTPQPLRLAFDPQRGIIDIYGADFVTPIMSMVYDPARFPQAADFGYGPDVLPFIAFGFPDESQASGSLDVYGLKYSYEFEAWEGRDLLLPEIGTPGYTATGAGTALFQGTRLRLLTGAGQTRFYTRPVLFSPAQGVAVEALLQITSSVPQRRSGVVLLLDDGVSSYVLSFIDQEAGKYVCLAPGGGALGFTESTSPKLSFQLDWTQEHLYRMERARGQVQIFVDGVLKLTVPDSAITAPVSLFGLPRVGFGNYSVDGATSLWGLVRTFAGGGYEVSTKKDEPEALLREENFDTEAVLLVSVSD